MAKCLGKMDKKRRIAASVLALVFVISTFMSGTLTWFASASAKNEFTGVKGNYEVELKKLEKDINGNITEVPVQNAEFYLFRIISENSSTVQQIGERYTTDAEGKIKVGGLASGKYYFIETSPSYSYEYDKDGDEDKTRYEFTVDANTAADGKPVQVVVYNLKRSAALSLEKKVENQDGTELTEEQKAMDFEFKVTFSDGGKYPYTLDGVTSQELSKDSTLTLKHGQKAVFQKVPVGIQYSVEEVRAEDYVVSSENSSGNIAVEGSQAVFTNTYTPKEKVSSLVISKTVTGAGDTEKYFEFKVTLGEDPQIDYPYQILDADDNVVGAGSIKSGDRIQLKHGQRAVFASLPIGLSYEVTETLTEGYEASLESQNGSIMEACNVVKFVNDMPYGNLIVRKEVTGPDADMTKEFAFHAVIGGKTFDFTLTAGQTKTFENIPVGTAYGVVESDYYPEGYVTSSINSVGHIQRGVTEAVFTNAKEELPEETGTLIVRKTVVNGNPEDSFKFRVQIGEETKEIELKDGGIKVFDGIPVGTSYSVVEDDYYEQGYITTSTGASGTITKDGAVAEYVNTKIEPQPMSGSLHINKKVSGAGDTGKKFVFRVEFSEEGEYTYRIDDGIEGTTEEEKQVHTLPEDGRIELKHGETAVFEDLHAGLTYRVIEDDYSGDGYIQGVLEQSGMIALNAASYADFNNYKEPDKNDGKLIVKKTTAGEGADLNKKFTFHVKIGEKVEDISLANGEQKEFTLPEGTPFNVIEDNYLAEGYVQSGITNGSGSGSGSIVEVTCTNTYLPYMVKTQVSGTKTWEVPEGTKLPDSITVYVMNGQEIVASKQVTEADGWKYSFDNLPKYDSSGREIAYTVDEMPIDNYVKEVNGTDIKNSYVKPITQAVPQVEKRISVNGDKEAKEATFGFTLEGLNDAPMPEGTENSKKTIQINGEGKASFGNITYSTEGTYTYLISEVNGSTKGYFYDSSVYIYKVIVSYEEGALKAAASLTEQHNPDEQQEGAVFENIYTPQEEGETSLTVNKVWAGSKNPEQPSGIEVQLMKDGEPYGAPVPLSGENNWTHTWAGLDETAVWTVKEAEVPKDYSMTITENGTQGYTITNTYIADGGNPPGGNNNQTDGGSSGKQYKSSSSGGTAARTGDNRSIWIWIILMVASAASLKYVIFGKRIN